MAGQKIEVQGKTADEIFNLALDKGISRSDAAVLVSGWIFENFGRTARTFNYAQAFPAVAAECVARFARSFQHADWIDGESVVQAETTTVEEGFNLRFHRIETDLDALGADVSRAFACLAEMRRSLRSLLDEVRAELNRINSDVFECCNKAALTPGIKLPPFVEIVKDPGFLGVTKFGDEDVSIWKTEHGTLVLPAVKTVGIDPATNPRVKRAIEIAQFAEENRRVREAFAAGPVTKKRLVDDFGGEISAGGLTVREMIDILPDDASFNTLNDLVNAVTEREAAALRTSGGPGVAAGAFGVGREVTGIGSAPVADFQPIPPDTRKAMVRAGIDTMDKLANTSPADLAAALRREGVAGATPGQAARFTAMARTLRRVQ